MLVDGAHSRASCRGSLRNALQPESLIRRPRAQQFADTEGGVMTGVDLGRTGHARSDLYLLISNILAELQVDYSLPTLGQMPDDMGPPTSQDRQPHPLSPSSPLPQIPEAFEAPIPQQSKPNKASGGALQQQTGFSPAAQQPFSELATKPAQPSLQLRRPLPLPSEASTQQRRAMPIDAPARAAAPDERRRMMPKSPFQTVQGSPP